MVPTNHLQRCKKRRANPSIHEPHQAQRTRFTIMARLVDARSPERATTITTTGHVFCRDSLFRARFVSPNIHRILRLFSEDIWTRESRNHGADIFVSATLPNWSSRTNRIGCAFRVLAHHPLRRSKIQNTTHVVGHCLAHRNQSNFRCIPFIINSFCIFSLDTSRQKCWRSIRDHVILIPLFTICLTLIFTDLNFWDWLTGIIKHARHIAGRNDPSFLRYFIVNLPLPFMVLFLVYFLFWALPALKGKKLEAQLAILALIFSVYYGSVRLPPAVYNLAWLIPAIFYFGFTTGQSQKPTISNLLSGFLLAVLSITFSLSALFYTNIYYANIHSGRKAVQLIDAIHGLPESTTFSIDTYSLPLPALMWFEIDNDRFIFDPKDRKNASHRIEFQAYFQSTTPSIGDGECLVATNFHQTRYKVFGIEYQYSPLDWAFAIIKTRDC